MKTTMLGGNPMPVWFWVAEAVLGAAIATTFTMIVLTVTRRRR